MQASTADVVDQEVLKGLIRRMYSYPGVIPETLERYPSDSIEYRAAAALNAVGVPNPASGIDTSLEQIYLRGMLVSPDAMIPQVRANSTPEARLGRLLTAIEHPPKHIGRDEPAIGDSPNNPQQAAIEQSLPPPAREPDATALSGVDGASADQAPAPNGSDDSKPKKERFKATPNPSANVNDIVDQALNAQASAAEITDSAARRKALDEVAYDTYEKLLAASGSNAEQLAKKAGIKISPKTFHYWREKRLITYDTMLKIADTLAMLFVPGDTEKAPKAANIMMGLPWAEPRNYHERMQYAVTHGQPAKEVLDVFRYQERANVEAAWQKANQTDSRDYDAITAFRTYLSQGLPEGEEVSADQFNGFRSKIDSPNTPVINHVARRIGAESDDDVILFRKLVFQYPIADDLTKNQIEVEKALIAIEEAGPDKGKRKEAFHQMENALMHRDGLRSRGPRLIREELAAAIYDNASKRGVLPEGIDAEKIKNALAAIAADGGETTVGKEGAIGRAELIATYIFPDDSVMRERCVAAYAPSRLVEAVPGEGNRFRSGETPHRPAWSHAATMQGRTRKERLESATGDARGDAADIMESAAPVADEHTAPAEITPLHIAPTVIAEAAASAMPPTNNEPKVNGSHEADTSSPIPKPSAAASSPTKDELRAQALATLADLTEENSGRLSSHVLRCFRNSLADSSLDGMAARLGLPDFRAYRKIEDGGQISAEHADAAIQVFDIPATKISKGPNARKTYQAAFLTHCVERPRAVMPPEGYEGPSRVAGLFLDNALRKGTGQRQALGALRDSLPEGYNTKRAVAGLFGVGDAEYGTWEAEGKFPADKVADVIRIFRIPADKQDGFKQHFSVDAPARASTSSGSLDHRKPPQRWQERTALPGSTTPEI